MRVPYSYCARELCSMTCPYTLLSGLRMLRTNIHFVSCPTRDSASSLPGSPKGRLWLSHNGYSQDTRSEEATFYWMTLIKPVAMGSRDPS